MQQRLADEVRNLVLVTEAGQAFGRQDSESGLLESMTRSARILFDFEHTVILLENPASGELVGAPAPGLARVAELTIPLGRGGVLAGVALEQRIACVDRSAPELGLAEQQLLRILGSESMVCVPLIAGALPGRAGGRRGRLAGAGLPAARTVHARLRGAGRPRARGGHVRAGPGAPPAGHGHRRIPRSVAPRGARGEQPAGHHQELPERAR
ncbi:hypothetical protein LP419_23265 [Massilia sp. H-1]|nr:hypothetical protein LP419_23265 [Massilia sp. H-1]